MESEETERMYRGNRRETQKREYRKHRRQTAGRQRGDREGTEGDRERTCGGGEDSNWINLSF